MSFEEAAGSEIAELLSWGLLERQTAAEEPQLRLTPRGVFLYDAVAAKIAAV
jgi:hypothetical protein